MSPSSHIGELLVRAGLLRPEQLEQVRRHEATADTSRTRLGQMLADLGMASESQLVKVLSQQLSVPWVSLDRVDFSPQLLSLVPREIAEAFCLVPIYVRRERGTGDTLFIAMDDPTQSDVISRVGTACGMPVKCMIASPSDIYVAIGEIYGERDAGAAASKSVSPPGLPVSSPPRTSPTERAAVAPPPPPPVRPPPRVPPPPPAAARAGQESVQRPSEGERAAAGAVQGDTERDPVPPPLLSTREPDETPTQSAAEPATEPVPIALSDAADEMGATPTAAVTVDDAAAVSPSEPLLDLDLSVLAVPRQSARPAARAASNVTNATTHAPPPPPHRAASGRVRPSGDVPAEIAPCEQPPSSNSPGALAALVRVSLRRPSARRLRAVTIGPIAWPKSK